MDTNRVISFDFHNTLAQCDEWFDLEVRDLIPAFLSWQAAQRGKGAPDETTINQAVDYYREVRREVMESGIEQDAHTSVKLVCNRLGIRTTNGEIDRGLAEVMYPALHSTTALPGAVEAVKSLRGHGHKLAVISSAIYHPFLDWTLEKFDIAQDIEVVITSASCGWYKSTPRIYEHALELLDVSPSSMIHVGDSYRFDVEPASSIGISTVLVDWGGLAAHQKPALATIRHLNQLFEIVTRSAPEPV